MTNETIDLRSDTITKPTPAMLEAMVNAEVGDDVYGEDPSINALEAYTAELLGKEAAIYMPSGTMTNQVALRVHTEPADEVILESQAHIYYYEGGAPAALSGVSCRLIEGKNGIFTAADLQKVLHPNNIHFPRTKLVCLENTHNRGGGSIYPFSNIQEISEICRQRGLKLHLDGARFWNACVATGISEAEYAQPFDTVSVCFSKGLGAPVGSALVGSQESIDRARRFRKMFGGGMRQAGIIAAAALYALKHHRSRLAEDHENAKILATGLKAIEGIKINLEAVQTNIVIFETENISAGVLGAKLQEKGVAILAIGGNKLRAVTSLAVTREQIEKVPNLVETALKDDTKVAMPLSSY
ncbi:MAG: low-specificity L-threonine aldolase [Prochloraceae cyanobacterium]